MKATPIPTRSRQIVKAREAGRCLRCGSPRGAEWHHRRSRSVRDEHTHCPCNGVLLCSTCHKWAHANPFDARATGFIVSRTERRPGDVPVQAYYGLVHTDCAGLFNYAEKAD